MSPRGGLSAVFSRRLRWRLAAVMAVGVLCFDLSRAPEAQWTARVLLSGIDFYQATLSPVLGVTGVRCRFEPTCSRYAEESIRRHGALVGSARTAWRILRCGPWTEQGTYDPP